MKLFYFFVLKTFSVLDSGSLHSIFLIPLCFCFPYWWSVATIWSDFLFEFSLVYVKYLIWKEYVHWNWTLKICRWVYDKNEIREHIKHFLGFSTFHLWNFTKILQCWKDCPENLQEMFWFILNCASSLLSTCQFMRAFFILITHFYWKRIVSVQNSASKKSIWTFHCYLYFNFLYCKHKA